MSNVSMSLVRHDPVSSLLGVVTSTAARAATACHWSDVVTLGKGAVRYLSVHSGVPALLVAAVLLSVGYRVLKKSMRFLLEVAAVSLALVAASQLGWISW